MRARENCNDFIVPHRTWHWKAFHQREVSSNRSDMEGCASCSLGVAAVLPVTSVPFMHSMDARCRAAVWMTYWLKLMNCAANIFSSPTTIYLQINNRPGNCSGH